MLKAPRDVIVLDIIHLYHTGNISKLQDPVEQYKAKFETMRALKFDPFVMGCTVVASALRSDI